jgi:hypothetical protein
MRPVRLTKAEAAVVRAAITLLCSPWGSSGADEKAAARVITKLNEAEGDASAGVAAGPIEAALIRMSRGKVVQLAGGAAYGRASKMATAVGATVEEAELVGAWLSRQRWLNEPTTLLGVLNKWAEWLPRARATAPPPAAAEGFDGTASAPAGTQGSGQRGGGGGPAPGFR